LYRYLDRPVAALAERDRFLVGAMRTWVRAARQGRCQCHDLRTRFAARGLAEALPDFAMLMATLDHEATSKLSFGACDCTNVSPDEARLLALFATADEGPIARVKRVAATFVVDPAVQRLTQAADFVATALATADTGRVR
jgi:hypothetical protein